MQNSVVMFTFSVLEWKYHFCTSLDQKIKIVSLNWNLVPRLIQTCRIQWWRSFFLFSTGNTNLGKFGPKIQICQFNVKPSSYANSNMQNLMVVFTFSVLNRKYPLWANLVQKNKTVTLSWNLVPRIIRICRIQWWYSLFLFQNGNTLFE